MEKAGKVARQVLEGVGRKRPNIKDSTPSGYRCEECRKELSWKEYQESHQALQKWELPGLLCGQHLRPLVEKQKKRFLADIKSGITAVLDRRNIPLRYLNCSFGNFEPLDAKRQKYLRVSREYVKKHGIGEGLFFTGPNGTGKTHLAVAIMRELSLRGNLGWYFVKTPYLLMTIRQAFKKEHFDSEQKLISRFINYDYLVIDELGVEKITDWSLQTLYLIIDGRSDQLKSTIITSNLSLLDVREQVDPRLASRIVGMSKNLLEFTCDDWRLRKKG